MYGTAAASSGWPDAVWSAVSGRNDGSVLRLQVAVLTPSQSTSRSAFQCTAMPCRHTGMRRGRPSSVANLPAEICSHVASFARMASALGGV